MRVLSAIVVTLGAVLFVLLWLVPSLAARTQRPRFVVALVLAALAGVVYQGAATWLGADAKTVWPGLVLGGNAGRAAALVHAGVCALIAWGLWRMQAWGRWLGMAYLGALIASFLFWGVRGHDEDLATIIAWQAFVLPLLTFGFMYLQRGSRYFRAR